MTERHEQGPDAARPAADALTAATEWFLRLRAEDAGPEDLVTLQRWLEEDPGHRRAYARVSASWSALGQHAAAPEIMAGRRDALEDARRASQGRWHVAGARWLRLAVAAGCATAVMVLGLALWSQAYAGVYSTDVGERRSLTLADGSVVTLDARSRVRVRYRDTARLICLEQGQARFDVAKNPAVPFLVKAGHETIVALGTQFNVELVARSVLVTLIAGSVEVRPDASLPGRQIALRSGEALQVRQDGRAVRLPRVDVERVTAWQNGRLFFDNEPLASAAERLNRYALQQIQVDPSAADIGISGVFNAGDAHAFVEAVTAYFPVTAVEESNRTVRLTARD